MTDIIKKIGNSLIHYGRENNRIYLMKLNKNDCPDIIEFMNNLALNEKYEKIIAKVSESLKDIFLQHDYAQEAYIKNFYNGKEDVYFLSKYFSDNRKIFLNKNEILNSIQFCSEKSNITKHNDLEPRFSVKRLSQENIPDMIKIFKIVFQTYPFPIFDSEYILKTMHENIEYYGVFIDDDLIAVASSEMDLDSLNTEMTDFAVLPEYRGNNLAYHLLKHMEEAAKIKGIKTAYTIARAKSIGMNMTFAKMNYEFGGVLINNTNICGELESMNVWYKSLQN
jgi:putative beta-lysine N-acetyltransferase